MKMYVQGEALPEWVDHAREQFEDEQSGGIFRDRDDPGLWLREFNLEYNALIRQVNPETIAEEGYRHLNMLSEFGLQMPHTEWYVSPVAFSSRRQQPTLYIAAEHIRGRLVNGMKTSDFDIDDQFVLADTARSIHAYNRWAEETKQEFGLCDLGPLRNYMYGFPFAGGPKGLYFVDNEPVLGRPMPEYSQVYEDYNPHEEWLQQGAELQKWAGALGIKLA